VGWWQTEYGLMGDAPADAAQDAIGRVPATVSAAELVAAIARVVATDGAKLFAAKDESLCWAILSTEAGGVLDHAASTPPDRLVALVKTAARKIAGTFRTELGRAPTPPELVDAFDFVIRTSRFALALRTVVDEYGLTRADVMVRRKLAFDPTTPRSLVEVLGRDPSDIVRNAVRHRLADERALAETKDPATPAARLIELARHPKAEVALAVLENPTDDPRVVEALLESTHDIVRVAMAEDARTKPAMLDRLSQDRSKAVRVAVAERRGAPPAILAHLARAGDQEVAWAALRNPSLPPELLSLLVEEDRYGVRRAIASNPATNGELLETLARDLDWAVRLAVASRLDLPATLAEVLARDPNREVVLALARNPACPRPVAEQLARDYSPDVVRAVRGW
jgi:hypothetical protein